MSSPNKSWTVVLFTEDQTVEAVPSRWINGDSCLWPAVPRDKLLPLLKKCEYNSCWPSLPVRIFRNATYDNFCVARAKASKAEATSELNTDDTDGGIASDLTRISKRKPKKKIFSSSSDESDEEIVQRSKRVMKSKLPPAPVWQEEKQLDYEATSDDIGNVAPLTNSQEQISQHQLTYTNNDSYTTDTPIPANNRCSCNPRVLYNIQSLLVEMNEKVNKLLKKKQTNDPESTHYTNILEKSTIRYPMEAEESLEKFEEFFSSSENYRDLVSLFANQGGHNLYEFIKRCLAPLLEDKMAQAYSYTGKKGKKEFSKLKLSKAIIDSALKVGISSNKKEVELKIGDWLRRAPERKRRMDMKNREQR